MISENLASIIVVSLIVGLLVLWRKEINRQHAKKLEQMSEKLKQYYINESRTFTAAELYEIATKELIKLEAALKKINKKHGVTLLLIHKVIGELSDKLPKAIKAASEQRIVKFVDGYFPLLPVIDVSWLSAGAQISLAISGNDNNEVFHFPPKNLIDSVGSCYWAINIDSGEIIRNEWERASHLIGSVSRSALTLEEVVAIWIQRDVFHFVGMRALNSIGPERQIPFATSCIIDVDGPASRTLSYGGFPKDPKINWFPSCTCRV